MGQEQPQSSRSAVLLFTDVVGSTDLKSRHGTLAYAQLLRRHNSLFEECAKLFDGHQILKHTGDGYFATFATASDAVRFALLFQAAMRDADWQPEPLRTRVGIHAGEVAVMTMIGKADVIGYAADVAARVMSLGEGGQILLTRSVFDDARQFVDEHPVQGDRSNPPKLRWVAHGPYLFKGSDRPLEVFEVGAEGAAPLRAPPDAEKARRVVPESEKKQLGWRPALGQTIPNRPDWRLSRRLRSDSGEESWVGTNKATGEKRTFRFLFDDAKTRTVRDVQTVPGQGATPGDQSVLDSQLDHVPAFIALAAGEDAVDDPGWIGPYRVIGRIGEGGMGIIYRGEQREPIRREVALKLIKLGMDSREVLARFDAERQALALMNHPGIARVLDAGISDTGRPYFAMEYIAGERITDYCDRQQLSTRQRLELFDKVCDAVQHAHSKGVIHRDLKPSNILVTIRDDMPTPVIIDFGVARATNHRLTEHSVFTERGQLIGTPEYMSPEQAEMSAVDIDTRTDIYSLGVILYELLIGALPFDAATLRSAAYGEIQRIIREVDPPRMSTRLSALGDRATDVARRRRAALDALSREVRGELEWIPLRAMRKDRTERYRTAAELGDDVRNYLSQLPLRAGPESAAYRLRKFIRRNRSRVIGASVASAAVLGTILIALLVVTHQRNEARRARAEAERNYQAARQAVLDFFTAVSQSELLRYERLAPLRRALLQRAADYFSAFAKEHASDTIRRADLAQALNVLGDAQTQLGALADSRVTLLRSIETRRALAAEAPADTRRQVDLAAAVINLANLEHTEANFANAAAGYTEALRILQPAHGQGIVEATSLVALAHHNLAVTANAQADSAAAEREFVQAIQLRRSLVTGHPTSDRYAAELAASLTALGKLKEPHEPAAAIAPVAEAIELRRRVLAGNPDATPELRALAEATAWLAQLQSRLGDARAEETNRAAIELWKTLCADPRHLGQPSTAAEAYSYLSWLHLLNRDFPAAETAARRGLDLRDGDPSLTINLGHAMLLEGRTDDAVVLYRRFSGRLIDGVPLAEYLRADFGALARYGVTSDLAERVLSQLN